MKDARFWDVRMEHHIMKGKSIETHYNKINKEEHLKVVSTQIDRVKDSDTFDVFFYIADKLLNVKGL